MNIRTLIFIIMGLIIIPFLIPTLLVLFVVSAIFISMNPLSETMTCTGLNCTTVENLLFGTTTPIEIVDKNTLEIQTVRDLLNINQYYIRVRNSNENYAFRTAYLSKKNAERDLKIIKENYHVRIVKRNVILMQGFCITLYVILLIIGNIINRTRQNINYHHTLYTQHIEEQNGTREN